MHLWVRFFLLAACVSTLSLTGCAYHFQEARNPLTELGIHKIYVAGFRNSTYRPGIEQYFTTAMAREIASSKSFELVNSEKDADAMLKGTVTSAEDGATATNYVKVGGNRADVPVASEFDATVNCEVRLVDRRGRQIFAQSVSSDKVHPGSGSIGDAGATASLNNDSEQRLAIEFLASQMMTSVYQRMVDTF
jgi:hypothetical protein